MPFVLLGKWFSKCGPYSASTSPENWLEMLSWETHLRDLNRNSRWGPTIHVLASSPGHSGACPSLGATSLGWQRNWKLELYKQSIFSSLTSVHLSRLILYPEQCLEHTRHSINVCKWVSEQKELIILASLYLCQFFPMWKMSV